MTKFNPANKHHIEHPWNKRARKAALKAEAKLRWLGHPTDWHEDETPYHIHHSRDVPKQGPSSTHKESSSNARGTESRDDSMGQKRDSNKA